MKKQQEQERRILAVIGDYDTSTRKAFQLWYKNLSANLTLPCETTGIEDFRWEEFYVFGPGNRAEYQRLRRDRPSYKDVFELLRVNVKSDSEWCLVPGELKARVRRKTDGKTFVLGLSELKATHKDSKDYQLLHDYSVWVANCR